MLLLPAVLSPASLVSSAYHRYLKVSPGELSVCSPVRGGSACLCHLQLPSAMQGQLPVIIKHVNDAVYPRGAGRAL